MRLVGQDHVRPIRDKKIAVHFDSGFAQATDFLQKGERVEHHAIADHTTAIGAQHAAGHQLENKLFAVDDDGVSGVVAAGIASYDREALRQHVNDLPFSLIAPLGAYDHRSLAFFQFRLRQKNFTRTHSYAAPGVAHSLPAEIPSQKLQGYNNGEDV